MTFDGVLTRLCGRLKALNKRSAGLKVPWTDGELSSVGAGVESSGVQSSLS